MSTNSTILIHVVKKDIGKRRKCDIDKIALRTEEQEIELYKGLLSEKEVREMIASGVGFPNYDKFKTGVKSVILPEWIEIYHHWDGYPNSLGQILLEDYNDYEKALNLALAGGFSTILNGAVPYAALGFKWKNIKPLLLTTLPDPTRQYQYIFDKGKWYYRESYDRRLRLVKKI